MKKPHWTEEELDLLRYNYLKKTGEDLHNLLPTRSWGSIVHKAERLGLINLPVNRYLRPQRIGSLNLEDRCYLAGLIDGDGSISIGISGQIMTPIVNICNTNQDLMNHVAGKLFANVNTNKGTRGRKDVLEIQLSRLLDVKTLLEQISPYSIGRKRQAELVLEYCNIRLKDRWVDYHPRLVQIANEVRRMNRRAHGGLAKMRE